MKLNFIFLLLLVSHLLQAQINKNKQITTGPPSGTLIAIGGNASDDIFFPYFRDYSGGLNAKIVIIPTARDDASINEDSDFIQLKKRFLDLQTFQ